MVVAVVVVFLFIFIQLIVALVNLFGSRELPVASSTMLSEVSVLIPARNEASNLPPLLDDLLRLPVSPLEIVICDDHSTDATFVWANEMALHHPSVRVFRSAPLPSGWQGKNFACYQLARQAKGRYWLFLDADVRVDGTDMQRTLVRMQERSLSLLSVFPRQIMLTLGEKTTVPLMTYILLTLLPLPLVYRVRDQSALAAANGQYMLFDALAYRRLQPHRQVRQNPTEDIAIARYYKSRGQRIACLTGLGGIACRMYHSRKEAIRGFARNIAAFFGGSLWLGALFWILSSLGWIPVLFLGGGTGLIVYLVLWFMVRILVSLACRQSVFDNLIWAFAQQGNMLLMLLQAWHSRRMGQQDWKGRNILS